MSKTIQIPFTCGPHAGKTISIDAADFARKVDRHRCDLRRLWCGYMDLGLLAYSDSGTVALSPRGEDLLASIGSIPDDPKPKHEPCKVCGDTGQVPIIGNFTNPCECVSPVVSVDAPPFKVLTDSGRVSSSQPNATSLPREGATRLGYSALCSMPGADIILDPAHPRFGETRPRLHTRDITPRHPALADMAPTEMERWNDEVAKLMLAYTEDKIAPSVYRIVPKTDEHPWVLIDSEEVARQFVGKCVEIDAPACVGWPEHTTHGQTHAIHNAGAPFLIVGESKYALDWHQRGNVRLRLVSGV